MPTYNYECTNCNHLFEQVETIANRNAPCEKPCPKCKEIGVEKSWVGQTPGLGADTTLTPDKKTGGQWGELMSKMKRGMPKRYHKNMDRATNKTGSRWKT